MSLQVVRKVIQRDIVIRFNSLTFARTALSGFQSTGISFLAQAALSGFQLAGCTNIFFNILSLICALTFVVRGMPLFCLGVST